MSEKVTAQQNGAVLTVINNDPDTRNSLSIEFYAGFSAQLERAGRDPSIGAVVLTGAGEFFCSGGNLSRLQQRTRGTAEERRAGIEKLHSMIRAIRDCPVPVIASVEGGTAGAGVSLAFACDMVISANNAKYSVAYVKVGLSPDGGASSFLSQALPRQLVSELLLTGSAISAQRLQQFGLINMLVEPGKALEAAIGMAKKICAGPTRAQRRIKRLCAEACSNDLHQQLDLEASLMTESLGDSEAKEGIKAFFDKRQPNFNESSMR